MALDSTGLFTVIGKYVKAINTWNGYITTLETQKDDIYTVLDAEDLQDLYVDLPSQFLGFKSAVASWISSLIGEVEDILLDEDYVTDELPIFQRDVTTVLNAIYDYMVDNSLTIKSSVVSIGGSDADTGSAQILSGSASAYLSKPRIFVTRTLDGLTAPSDSVAAHTRYNNIEGQLSMSCTLKAKCISSSEGAETMQIFSELDAEAPYSTSPESPGNGPTITNIEASNIVPNNYDFSAFSGDNPTGWIMSSGSAGTDWQDESGTEDGPLGMKTAGVYCKQQLTGLTRRQMYFVGAFYKVGGDNGETATTKLRLENSTGVTVHKNLGSQTYTVGNGFSADDLNYYQFGFYSPSDTVNLNDIYVAFEHDAESDATISTVLKKIVVAPVSAYYNGLGVVFWNGLSATEAATYADTSIRSPILVNEYGSLAISNSNAGVFQTFFRRAFGIQLPTADSPTIADSLAT